MKGQNQLSRHLLATRESQLSANTRVLGQKMKYFVKGKYYGVGRGEAWDLVGWLCSLSELLNGLLGC